jgi:hypothetical protein
MVMAKNFSLYPSGSLKASSIRIFSPKRRDRIGGVAGNALRNLVVFRLEMRFHLLGGGRRSCSQTTAHSEDQTGCGHHGVLAIAATNSEFARQTDKWPVTLDSRLEKNRADAGFRMPDTGRGNAVCYHLPFPITHHL